MKKWIILIGVSFLIFQSNINKKNELKSITIPDEAIRLRVIANSNNYYDQNTKRKVSLKVQDRLAKLLKDTKGIKEARIKIKDNIDLMDKDVAEVLKKDNVNYPYKIDFGYHYFPKKTYKGVEYAEGEYESLYITLGKGEGENWWCVLFPPLCIMEATDSQTDDVEYHSLIKDILDKYL